MVKIKDTNGELVFKLDRTDEIATGEIIRINPEAAQAIDEIRRETGLSAKKIATEFILFASKHCRITQEGENEQI